MDLAVLVRDVQSVAHSWLAAAGSERHLADEIGRTQEVGWELSWVNGVSGSHCFELFSSRHVASWSSLALSCE